MGTAKRFIAAFLCAFAACGAVTLLFVRTGGSTAADSAAETTFEKETPDDADKENPESGADTRRLAVVMYHNVLKSRKGTYIVSPDQFESDLAAYSAAGYTTVFPSEVVDFVYGGGSLPEKPLLVTFDDGRYNNMYYALPLLEKYGAKAAFYPVGAFSAFSTESGDHSNPNYSHITWEQMGELVRSGRVELGSHSYNMHRYEPRFGIKPKPGESAAQYRTELAKDTGRLQDAILRATGVMPESYAYPFGAYCGEALAVLRSFGLKLFLTCNEGVSTIKRGAPETLFRVCRVNRDGAYSSADLVARLDNFR